MSDTTVVIVYTLYADIETAQQVAAEMVQGRLAACANILSPSRSCYMWNGLFEQQSEYPVLFKTTEEQREMLMARLAQGHPYDIPAILSWTADSASPYALWVREMTGKL
jgi:periplasmic divalent cation tolerance protein